MNAIYDFLYANDFMPHGYCLLWDPALVGMHVVSDSLVTIAYFSLPVFLVVLVRRRKDIQFNWMIGMFALFITLCGITHLFNIWTLFVPSYEAQGVLKVMTALASIATAMAAWPLLPKLLAIPSPAQLQKVNLELHKANDQLEREISARQAAERALREKSSELGDTNRYLNKSNRTLKAEVDARKAAADDLQSMADSLRSKQDELRQSNEDLETFAYVASHDLKAPLRAIDNLSQWIEEDLEDVLSDDSRENMALLRDRVGRMTVLLDDLLAYSRVGSKSSEPVDIDCGPFVEETFDLVNAEGRFSLKLDGTLPTMTAEIAMVRLVFTNLIANAMKHHDRETGTITVSCAQANDYLEFAVSDDGPGIPVEHHDRVFEMFQTLAPRDAVEGSGMGLACVKKAIAKVGGEIRLQSGTHDGERGLTVRFTWPRSAADRKAA